MADYGIFGHGSSGNSWFANTLDKFHGHTKKYDPLGHYSVEMPMKGAHWLVEKSSKGLADAGIGEGFNRRLNQEADENGNNFGLGSQRMGLGILSVLGGMYGYGAAGAGGASGGGAAGLGEVGAGGLGAVGGTSGGAGLGGLGSLGGGLGGLGSAGSGAAGGMPIGAGGYAEAGGGYVADAPGGGFNWLNGDGSTGATGLLGQGGSSSSLMEQLTKQGQGGGSGGQQGGGQSGGPQGTMLGNPSLTAALAKLVEGDQKAKAQRERGLLPAIQYQETGLDFNSLTADDFQRLLAMYQQQQQNGGYDGTAA